jgi:ribosomal protein S18 acetylase RimI-like enzyme
MSTSAEVPLRDGGCAVLRAVAYEDPLAQELIGRVQQEYVARYGGPDAAPVDAAEFRPPNGVFLVVEVDGVPAGCGAWRVLPDGRAEMKRVYVEPAFRRRGIARVVVDAIEADVARAGFGSLVLNTGHEQPEALALYAALGYLPVSGFGIYACEPGAVFLGKDLGEDFGEDLGKDLGKELAGRDEESRSWAS